MTKGIQDTLSLDDILLDPNNYRFRDHKDYKFVPDEDIVNPSIQYRTSLLITGKKNENIQDLIISFRESGFLPVDQIQVQKIKGTNKYKVIEGNRRIATLKHLRAEKKNSYISLGKLDKNIFDAVPVINYNDENKKHYYVLMGLKHISGNKKWPLVNQAELIRDMVNEGMKEQQVADSLGETLHRVRRSLRALALVEAYKKSDFGDQFSANMFNIFDTVVNTTNFKNWLEWNDWEKKALNTSNLDRFFTWISYEEVLDEKENTIEKKEPIINIGRDVREVAKFIDDEKALRFMEEAKSISEAYLSSDHIGKDKFDTTLNLLEQNLNTAMQFSNYATEDHTNKFEAINKKLKGLIASQDLTEILLPKTLKPNILFNFPNTKHFTSIQINSYKGLKGLNVQDLNQINLFAGDNNVGKTSLLEAIRILIAQNDANDYLALQQLRGKFAEGKMPPHWIIENFPKSTLESPNPPIDIEGLFGLNQPTEVTIRTTEDVDADKSSYLGSLSFYSSFMGNESTSLISFFDKKEDSYTLATKKIQHLCSFAYVSPFSGYWNPKLFDAHAENVANSNINIVISFLNQFVDNDIQSIQLVDKHNLKRFLVEHKQFKGAVDLSQFGDGVQHIFRTTLQFAIAENGVLLIDEIETAIHHSLMIDFSKFIQLLAEKFNVQVFITSHSGECINAFVNNKHSNEKIAAFNLNRDIENKISCTYINAAKFERLIHNFSFDLRGK